MWHFEALLRVSAFQPLSRAAPAYKLPFVSRIAVRLAGARMELNRLCVVQHELLQRLAPLLEEPMHPFDCCASVPGDKRPSSGFSKPLPISRRASAASHEDLHHLINQVPPRKTVHRLLGNESDENLRCLSNETWPLWWSSVLNLPRACKVRPAGTLGAKTHTYAVPSSGRICKSLPRLKGRAPCCAC